MLRLLSLLTVVFLLASLSGCSLFGSKRKPKSSTRIYQGDAPNVRITGEQSAGGELKPYR